jgi:hypothetical protein
MRGKQAKQLRRIARMVVGEEEYKKNVNVYDQQQNCHSWENVGKVDPDGNPVLSYVKKPGTITHANAYRRFYRQLKRTI